MALTQDDFVGAVARLNELTRLRVIKWLPCNVPPQDANSAFRSGVEMFATSQWKTKLSFETLYDERRIRITQYESAINPLSLASHKYRLDVIDHDGNTAFEFPEVEGISDLFRSIQTQKLDIEGFIRKLVSG